jgi:hypothetical protein
MNKFRCPYCNKAYARESWFRKHNCEKRQRFEQIHHMDFRRGLRLYTHWRIRNGYLKGRSKEITAKEFIASQFYTSFMKLVKFTSDNWVITSLKYLDFLIDNRIAEAKWTNEDTLKLYRDHTRRHDDPIVQTKETFESIKAWCEHNEIARCEFFAKVPPGTALQMVTSNRLSPWVLFGYDRSIKDLLTRMSSDWICSVNEFLNNAYWINKLRGSQDTQEAVQNECERFFGDE